MSSIEKSNNIFVLPKNWNRLTIYIQLGVMFKLRHFFCIYFKAK